MMNKKRKRVGKKYKPGADGKEVATHASSLGTPRRIKMAKKVEESKKTTRKPNGVSSLSPKFRLPTPPFLHSNRNTKIRQWSLVKIGTEIKRKTRKRNKKIRVLLKRECGHRRTDTNDDLSGLTNGYAESIIWPRFGSGYSLVACKPSVGIWENPWRREVIDRDTRQAWDLLFKPIITSHSQPTLFTLVFSCF